MVSKTVESPGCGGKREIFGGLGAGSPCWKRAGSPLDALAGSQCYGWLERGEESEERGALVFRQGFEGGAGGRGFSAVPEDGFGVGVELLECFALKAHPTLCEGRLPVLLTLCAPDGKRLATTPDWPAFLTSE